MAWVGRSLAFPAHQALIQWRPSSDVPTGTGLSVGCTVESEVPKSSGQAFGGRSWHPQLWGTLTPLLLDGAKSPESKAPGAAHMRI